MKSRQKGLQVLESVGIRPTLCVGDVVAVRITSRSRCVPHVVIRALGFVNVFKSQLLMTSIIHSIMHSIINNLCFVYQTIGALKPSEGRLQEPVV